MQRSGWRWSLLAVGVLGLLTLAAIPLDGCGYSTSTALLPTHLKTVGIPTFENESSEHDLQVQITEAVIRRFIQDNHLKVVEQRFADSIILGRITDYRNAVFGISPSDLAEEYRVSITVSVTFKDQVKNREIWTDENLTKTANYYVTPVPGDSARTEQEGRRLAILKIADEILSRTVESW